MRIDISRIIKHSGAFVDIDLEEDISLEDSRIVFKQPVKVTGTITNLGEVFVLEGNLTSSIRVVCDRCLNELDYDISVPVSEKFVFGTSVETDDVNVFNGGAIELTDVIKNNIILSLPIQFICSEDCKGLCSICGTNKNLNECNCQEEVIDSRLEKLKSLLNLK